MTGPASGAPRDAVPTVAPHVTVAEFEAESVLYDAIAARPVLLNVSAAAVWAAIDGRRTVAVIVAVIAEQFGARPADVEHDVVAAIERFAELGLVVLSSAAAG